MSAQNKNEFMPLEVGNKWFYTNNIDSISFVKEVISRDTINGAIYYKVKNTRLVRDSIITKFHHERIFNDTLFVREYSSLKNRITDRIVAVFSLNLGESCTTLKVKGEWEKKWTHIRGIRVVKKDRNIIEFVEGNPAIDNGFYITYEKGKGLVKTYPNGMTLVKYIIK